jgi:tetratricopeptide (TPR) repeat protein
VVHRRLVNGCSVLSSTDTDIDLGVCLTLQKNVMKKKMKRKVYFSLLTAFLWVFNCCHCEVQRNMIKSHENIEIENIRKEVNRLIQTQNPTDALNLIKQLEVRYQTLSLGKNPPSFYNLKGVALYESNCLEDALKSFESAVKFNSSDLRAWINLVALKSHFIGDYVEGIQMVEKLSGRKNINFATRNMEWKSFEWNLFETIERVKSCIEAKSEEQCDLLSTGLPYQLLPPTLLKQYLEVINELQGLTSSLPVPSTALTSRTFDRSIRIGFLLHRIDSGPVMNLSHLFFKYLNLLSQSNHLQKRSAFRTSAFFLSDHQITHYYQREITTYFDDTFSLKNFTIAQSVALIKEQKIDILIEMNGWNTNTAILIMKERPARILISYLADPITTGTNFIDYFIGDKIVFTPERTNNNLFSEKLVFLPTCYLVNSYLEWQEHLWKRKKHLSFPKSDFQLLLMGKQEYPSYVMEQAQKILTNRLQLVSTPKWQQHEANQEKEAKKIFIGVYHNWNKYHPEFFQVLMNILRRFPFCKLIFNHGSNPSNLFLQSFAYGIPRQQIATLPFRNDMYDHYYHKTAMDLYLDTTYKNGHVTSLDTQFVGIPMITLSMMTSSMMQARSTESILHYSNHPGNEIPLKKNSSSGSITTGTNFHSTFGLVHSLKEYEDYVILLLKSVKGRKLLKYWKQLLQANRSTNKLFDIKYFSKEFSYLLQSMMEMDQLKNTKPSFQSSHLFTDRG